MFLHISSAHNLRQNGFTDKQNYKNAWLYNANNILKYQQISEKPWSKWESNENKKAFSIWNVLLVTT